MKPKTNSSSKQAGVMEAAFIQTFLSDVKELRTKINMHQGVADAQPIFASVVAVWNDPKNIELLRGLHAKEVGGEYTIDRATQCINAGLRFAASMSGHSFGWVDEGLRIIEHRLSNATTVKKEGSLTN
jgi:hypothetical protein